MSKTSDRNRWNRIIYRLWAPFYDWFISRSFFVRERKKALQTLELQPGEKVLIVGVGTGPDFPFLPDHLQVTGIDLSSAMLSVAREKLPIPNLEIDLIEGNAEQLPFDDGSFDAAILFLILSVVGNPRLAIGEAIRVLRPGGRMVILDKFLPPGQKASSGRRMLNTLVTKPFGTDINRSLEPILEGLPCIVVEDKPSLFRGAYRIVRLEKNP